MLIAIAKSSAAKLLVCTNAVVAICVLLVLVGAVGAVGIPVNAGLSTLAFSLKVFQLVEVKYPLAVVVAAAIDIAGVDVPVATDIGAVPDTEVTVPTFVVYPEGFVAL